MDLSIMMGAPAPEIKVKDEDLNQKALAGGAKKK